MEKRTKKEIFGEIKGIFEDMQREDLVEFVNHELGLLERKATTKRAPKKECEEIKNLILTELEKSDNPMTITDLLTTPAFREYKYTDNKGAEKVLSNSKVSVVMKSLKDNNQVVRIEEKRKAYFSIAK